MLLKFTIPLQENDDGITENGVSSRTNGTGDARTNGAGPGMKAVYLRAACTCG